MFCQSDIHCSRDFGNEDGHMPALLLYLTANQCEAHVNKGRSHSFQLRTQTQSEMETYRQPFLTGTGS